MNDSERRAAGSPDQDFDRQLDRLVDGELNAAERRQLLADCDEREGAWRRCALAFLEAQAWRADLTMLTAPATSPVLAEATAVTTTSTPIAQPRAAQGWVTLAAAPWALAASALVAFSLGWLARPQNAAELVADSTLQTAQIAGQGAADPTIAAVSPPNEAEPMLGDTRSETPETITLVMDCGPDGEQRQIELPVLPAAEDDLAGLEQGEPVVSAELQAALLRMGHRVNERRQLVPLVLEDGRRLVVPVDEIEFTPVETSEYQ